MRQPNYRQVAAEAARRHGVPPNIFLRQIQQESGFNPNARSPAGAMGIAQFMPGTARGMGVNPMNPVQALDGAARMMGNLIRKFGRVDYALAAYNAGAAAVAHYHGIPPYKETRGYVRSIMGGLGSATGGAPGLPALGTGPHARLHTDTPTIDPARARIQAALTPNPELPQLLSKLGDSPTLQKVLQHMSEPIALPSLPAISTPTQGAQSALQSVGQLVPGVNDLKFAHLGPGADRPGVRTRRSTLAFVGEIGRMAGHPLTIGTGTDHDRMTVNGKVSDHWSGHAADIPATGKQLIHLGQLALIAAGMPRAKALKQRGGLYNVGKHQVIFNTHIGGDHTNHLHVSG